MSEPVEPAHPYRIDYTPLAIERLASLMLRAKALGHRDQLVRALRVWENCLRWYPEYGRELYGTLHPGGVVRLDTLEGLTLRYVSYNAERVVIVVDAPDWIPPG